MTAESWLPCQASGELPGSSERSSRAGDRLGVALADRVRVLGVGLVAAGDDDRRERRARASSAQCLERARARARRAARRRAPRGARARRAAGAARLTIVSCQRSGDVRRRRRPRRSPPPRPRAGPSRERVPAREPPRSSAVVGVEGGRDDDEAGDALGVVEREAHERVRAHRGAGQHARGRSRGRRAPRAGRRARSLVAVGLRVAAPASWRRGRARRRRSTRWPARSSACEPITT